MSIYSDYRNREFPPTQNDGSMTTGPVAVASAAGAGTPGSWVQLIASAAIRGTYILLTVMVSATASEDYEIEIGFGAAASEVTKFRMPIRSSTSAAAISVLIPFEVPSGTRVAARATNHTNATARTMYIGAELLGP